MAIIAQPPSADPLRTFAENAFKHWREFLGGASVSIIFLLLQWGGAKIPNWVYLVCLAFGLVRAFYYAWKDQFAEVEKLQCKLNEISERKIVPRLISRGNFSYLLLIENESKADVLRFKLQFTLPTAKIMIGNNYSNGLEIDKIFAGRNIQKHFTIGQGDPYEYEAVWSWTSFDGKVHQEKSMMRLEFKDAPSAPPASLMPFYDPE